MSWSRIPCLRPTGALWIDGVTIRNGQAQASSAGHDKFGGGIYNEGSLEVRSSTAMRNYARDGGGAIFNRGYLYMQDSTLNNNSAYPSSGGGIYNATNGEVMMLIGAGLWRSCAYNLSRDATLAYRISWNC
jgi:hypothetical protein